MAVNESRSMNNDLMLGATDGKFKSLTPDRGGVVDPTAATLRANELQMQYNVEERPAIANMPTAAYGRRK
jgi:hypothetical protein